MKPPQFLYILLSKSMSLFSQTKLLHLLLMGHLQMLWTIPEEAFEVCYGPIRS